jgi:hypothetical protein
MKHQLTMFSEAKDLMGFLFCSAQTLMRLPEQIELNSSNCISTVVFFSVWVKGSQKQVA